MFSPDTGMEWKSDFRAVGVGGLENLDHDHKKDLGSKLGAVRIWYLHYCTPALGEKF